MIVQVNVVLNRTVVVYSDWSFDNLCSSYLQGQSELLTYVSGLAVAAFDLVYSSLSVLWFVFVADIIN